MKGKGIMEDLNNLTEENEQTEQDINILKKIRIDKLDELKSNGKDPFQITKYDVTAHCADAKAEYEKLEAEIKEKVGDDAEALKAALSGKRIHVSIAGRMMSRRDMGKANFIDVRDASGRLQVYVRKNEIGDENFVEFKKWDIGDIVGVEGYVFRKIRTHATASVTLTLL